MTTHRRHFLLRASALLSALPCAARALGAPPSETLRAAVVGLGRGKLFVEHLAGRGDVSIAALCDVDEARLHLAGQGVADATGHKPELWGDFRRVVDDPSIDVVFVVTPHHWHCPMAIPLLQAGKDVYLEKPASQVFREGRLLVQAAEQHGRIVQHGTQMRSSDLLVKAAEVLASGVLGEIRMAKAWNVQRHSHPQAVPDQATPAGVDYDLWLGPAPSRPFNPNRFHRNWPWYRDYGSGDIGNDAAHDLDLARWGLAADTHPVRITAHGSRVDLEGEREYPDNMTVAYLYADGKVLLYEDRGWTPYGLHGLDSGNAFYGTQGYMIFTRRGKFQVYHAVGDQREEREVPVRGNTGWPDHVANFLDCVRTRQQPNADALTAHLSCALTHLGEIAYRTERVLHFDPQTETVRDDEEANAMLTKEYRAPWGLPDNV